MSDAPSAKDLEGAKLNKVKTKEAEGVDEDGKKAFKDVWKKHGGDFAKVKKDDQFKGMAWRHNFEPDSGDKFAEGVLKGLAFDD